jgi:hypothetical protein
MPCAKDPSRVDATGRACAGSQRQIQTYVNERESELSRAIADALCAHKINPTAIRWASPLKENGYSEYQDDELLKAVGAEHLVPKLSEFWPHRGRAGTLLLELKVADAFSLRRRATFQRYSETAAAQGMHPGESFKTPWMRPRSGLASNWMPTGWAAYTSRQTVWRTSTFCEKSAEQTPIWSTSTSVPTRIFRMLQSPGRSGITR